MIERKEVDGRMATVAYVAADWQPCSAEEAYWVKINFDDGVLRITFGPRQLAPKRYEVELS